jgi:hypothetical protein
MGTIIALSVDKLEIDWGKNEFFTDHSALFQTSDRTLFPCCFDEDNGVENKFYGYSKKLKFVKERLELLGYSLNKTKEKFKQIFDDMLFLDDELHTDFEPFWESFSNAVKSILINEGLKKQESEFWATNPLIFNNFYESIVTQKIDPAFVKDNPSIIFEKMDPYIILRLLAENKENEECTVSWNCCCLIQSGWIREDQIAGELLAEYKILIITEGSTDSFVLQKSLLKLKPEISDFFSFIDMKSNYPFTGTGSLYNFCSGLTKIYIQNKIIAIFDNDLAGTEAYEKAIKLERPKNMHISKLPNHDLFSSFDTIGPNGEIKCNINGLAVSIECFLDFESSGLKQPKARWTSYIQGYNQYQGSITDPEKKQLMKTFKNANLCDGSYNVKKLQFLLEHIISEWLQAS